MKFKVKPIQKQTYEPGECYKHRNSDRVLVIVEDVDRGFALMNVETAEITSDFYEKVSELKDNTTLGEMVQLKQINDIEFEE